MLPSHVVEATNVNMFKNELDRHWAQFKFEYKGSMTSQYLQATPLEFIPAVN